MIMNPEHPQWEQFAERMLAMERCYHDHDFAIEVLNMFPGIDIAATLAHFHKRYAHCDCEIIYKIILPHEEANNAKE